MNLDEQVRNQGLDVQPINEQGMGLVLKRLESARKLGAGYAQGMASEWLTFLADDCQERRRELPTLGTVLKAATKLANNPQVNYAAPSDLWAEVWKIARAQIVQALGNQVLELPAVVAGEPKTEIRYRKLWYRAAIATGDAQQSREWALARMGLNDVQPEITPMPENIKQRFKNLPKGLRK